MGRKTNSMFLTRSFVVVMTPPPPQQARKPVVPIFSIDCLGYSTAPNTRIVLKGAGLKKEQKRPRTFFICKTKQFFVLFGVGKRVFKIVRTMFVRVPRTLAYNDFAPVASFENSIGQSSSAVA